MPLEHQNRFVRRDIPEADYAVVAARDQTGTVRTERNGQHRRVMPSQRRDPLPSARRPHSHCAIVRTRCDPPAITADGERLDVGVVPRHRQDDGVTITIPQVNVAVR